MLRTVLGYGRKPLKVVVFEHLDRTSHRWETFQMFERK